MANVWIDSEILEAIGDALRYQYETNDKFYPRDMADAVENAEGVGTLDDYFGHEIYENTFGGYTSANDNQKNGIMQLLKKMPKMTTGGTRPTSLTYAFCKYIGECSPVLISDGVTDFSYMFYNCKNLIKILPFNTQDGINFKGMFNGCNKIKKMSNFIKSQNGTNFTDMFCGCTNLVIAPKLNTQNGIDFTRMFYNCASLSSISQLNGTKAISLSNCFLGCESLTDFEGFLNLGEAYLTTQQANYSSYNFDIKDTNLTYESLVKIANGLYDIATKGCNVQQFILGSKNMAKLTIEEIAIITNKGWTIS